MRLKDNLIAVLINILLGVAWALTFVSATSAFFSHYVNGLVLAIASAIVWMMPGLFLVLVLEYILSGFARLEEARKHTKLLEKIVKDYNNSREENSD